MSDLPDTNAVTPPAERFPPLLVATFYSLLKDQDDAWEATFGLPLKKPKVGPDRRGRVTWPLAKGQQTLTTSKSEKEGSKDDDTPKTQDDFPNIPDEKLERALKDQGYFNVFHSVSQRMNLQVHTPTHKRLRHSDGYRSHARRLIPASLPAHVRGITSANDAAAERRQPFVDPVYLYQFQLAQKTEPLMQEFSEVLKRKMAQPDAPTSSRFDAIATAYQQLMVEQGLGWDDRFHVTVPADWPADWAAAFGDALFPEDPATGRHLTPEVVTEIVRQWQAEGLLATTAATNRVVERWLNALKIIRNGFFKLACQLNRARARLQAQNDDLASTSATGIAPWLAQVIWPWDEEGDLVLTPVPSTPVIQGLADAIRADPRRRAHSPMQADLLPCAAWSSYYQAVRNETPLVRSDILVLVAEAHPSTAGTPVEALLAQTLAAARRGAPDLALTERWAEQLARWMIEEDSAEKAHDLETPSEETTANAKPTRRQTWATTLLANTTKEWLTNADTRAHGRADAKRLKRWQATLHKLREIRAAIQTTWQDRLAEMGVAWTDLQPGLDPHLDVRVRAVERFILAQRDEEGVWVYPASSDAYRAGLMAEWQAFDAEEADTPNDLTEEVA